MDEARTDRPAPGWRDGSRYDRLLALDLAGWAWETLRRGPDGDRPFLGLGPGRLLRRFPPIRLIETGPREDAAALSWGWRFP